MSALIWGQRVEISDETHPSYGRVGTYEGVISADLDVLRIRFPMGVIVARGDQVCAAVEHPVCIRRRLKSAGTRPLRERLVMPAPCLSKDYGRTAADLAVDAWIEAQPGTDESDGLLNEVFRHAAGKPVRFVKVRAS